jgi:hypothetical protein
LSNGNKTNILAGAVRSMNSSGSAQSWHIIVVNFGLVFKARELL